MKLYNIKEVWIDESRKDWLANYNLHRKHKDKEAEFHIIVNEWLVLGRMVAIEVEEICSLVIVQQRRRQENQTQPTPQRGAGTQNTWRPPGYEIPILPNPPNMTAFKYWKNEILHRRWNP